MAWRTTRANSVHSALVRFWDMLRPATTQNSPSPAPCGGVGTGFSPRPAQILRASGDVEPRTGREYVANILGAVCLPGEVGNRIDAALLYHLLRYTLDERQVVAIECVILPHHAATTDRRNGGSAEHGSSWRPAVALLQPLVEAVCRRA